MTEQMTLRTGDQTKLRKPISVNGLDCRAKVDFEIGSQSGMEVPLQIQELHAKALAAVTRWKTAEIELLQILDEVECHQGYLRYGYNSLFQYACKALGLSEGVAYNLINVGRAAREIPELKAEIASGALSVSKARKITSVLTRENSTAWIELAKTSSQQKLEREVSLANPRESGRGRMSYVPPQSEISEKVVVKAPSGARASVEPRVQLEVGVSEKLMIKIRHAQGLLGQKLRRGATLEETLEAMVDVYLSKHDPAERAKRQLMRGKLSLPLETSDASKVTRIAAKMMDTKGTKDAKAMNVANSGSVAMTSRSAQKVRKQQFLRTAGKMDASNSAVRPSILWGNRLARRTLPAATKHRVYLKFQARCSHVDRRGERCQATKLLEIHHLKPLHLGGDDRLENLTLLCSGHHKGVHQG